MCVKIQLLHFLESPGDLYTPFSLSVCGHINLFSCSQNNKIIIWDLRQSVLEGNRWHHLESHQENFILKWNLLNLDNIPPGIIYFEVGYARGWLQYSYMMTQHLEVKYLIHWILSLLSPFYSSKVGYTWTNVLTCIFILRFL